MSDLSDSSDLSDLALLRSAAEALYGPRWQRALAKDVGVSERTVHRWVARENPVPKKVLGELCMNVYCRIQALREIENKLSLASI